MSKFTHMDNKGRPKMMDVSEKDETLREAVAKGSIFMSKDTLQAIVEGNTKKGDVLSVAQTAGIMAVKRTSEIIPMCHNIPILSVSMDLEPDFGNLCIIITVSASTFGRTGIEMEVLHGVSTAALTIYDMVKSMDKKMVIGDIRVVKKTGGKSGDVYMD